MRATMTLSLTCKACGNTWEMTDDEPFEELDQSWTGHFGSDADFCPACETPSPSLVATVREHRSAEPPRWKL